MLLYEILKEFRYWIKVVALGQHTVFNPLVVQDKTANNRKQFFNSIAYLDERSNHDRVLSRGAISTVDDATYRIAQLNEDLLIMVLEYLDMKSLIRVSAVSGGGGGGNYSIALTDDDDDDHHHCVSHPVC